MKRKVKKYAGGNLVDSSGNPVRSGSGEPVRTRSDDEIAEDNKFGGYGRYMPKTRSITLGKSASKPSEDLVPAEPAPPSSEFVMQGGKKDLGNDESVKPIVDASGTPTDRLTARDLQSRKAADVSGMSKPKRKVVSKKELEDSGFQSLRDYLNNKQGKTRKMASGGKTSSASSRGDGIAQRGKTKGRIC